MKTIALPTLILSVLFFIFPIQSSYAEDKVYGWNMMSEQERIQHRETVRNLKTNEEKERYRIEHHKKMQKRAEQRGLSMPDMPMNRDDGMRPMQGGMGSGGGSGMGKGR